jgi:uncharacterized protein (DUF1499 family)
VNAWGHALLLVTGSALLAGCTGTRPPLGARDGRLAACPSTPNCVSSLATDDGHGIAPLRFTGSAAAAMARLTGIVRSLPRTTVTLATETYLHAECRSALFRFVDDLEFFVDERGAVIHVRSAARLGSWDLGVNRRRVEEIRSRWSGPPAPR